MGNKGQKKIIEITNILKTISSKIPQNIDWIIQVEGHTDNIPIATENFPSNWELSVARAIKVAKIGSALKASVASSKEYPDPNPIKLSAAEGTNI